jgi:hypothetical protein
LCLRGRYICAELPAHRLRCIAVNVNCLGAEVFFVVVVVVVVVVIIIVQTFIVLAKKFGLYYV